MTGNCITAVAGTVCELMGVEGPLDGCGEVIGEFLDLAHREGVGRVERCVVFAPDAIGTFMRRKYADLLDRVLEYAPVEVGLCSVVPPKTPVCFASMFTGAGPAVHGVMPHTRPVVRLDTVFDALVRGGRRVAITAVEGSSIDMIFREREIDYFSEDYDEGVLRRTVELIEGGEHDFILAYQQGYDDVLHRSGPETDEAIEAMGRHVASFVEIGRSWESAWRGYDRMIMFCPDHGGHFDAATGKGAHGDDVPADMEVTHFCGILKGGRMRDGCKY